MLAVKLQDLVSTLLGSDFSLVGPIIPCCVPILPFVVAVFILCHFMLDARNLCLLIYF